MNYVVRIYRNVSNMLLTLPDEINIKIASYLEPVDLKCTRALDF